MTALQKESVPGVYSLSRPARFLPLIFDSPHSGTVYPADFDYACDFAALEKAEDKYVDELFAAAPAFGAALLCAEFPRSYIDVNRCEKDIDTELLADEWPGDLGTTPRSHAGIGLIRRLVRPGIPLYDRPLKAAEIGHRIKHYYRPYHTALGRLINEAHYMYGQSWHINCHSMPAPEKTIGGRQPDFVLGDRDGTSCDPGFTQAVGGHLRALGYAVAINDPYKGVELVRRYSAPAMGRHSLQIEVAKSLYMDEKSGRKIYRYNGLKDDLDRTISFCAGYVEAQALPLAAD